MIPLAAAEVLFRSLDWVGISRKFVALRPPRPRRWNPKKLGGAECVEFSAWAGI